MSLLPVRPLPWAGESFPAYLLRLAVVNGWESLKQFLAAYDIKEGRHLDLDNSRLLETISQLSGHSGSIIENTCVPVEFRALMRDGERNIHVLSVNTPTLCPLCKMEGKYHQTPWQYFPITHCIEHDCHLISECPHCESAFQWDSGLMGDGCSECGATWSSMVAQNSTGQPVYQSWFLACENLDQQRLYMRDLITAALRVMRPADELLDTTERLLHKGVNWHLTLSDAHGLLSDRQVIEDFVNTCIYERQSLEGLGVNAVFAPLLALQAKLGGDWPLRTYCFSDSAVTSRQAFQVKSIRKAAVGSSLPARTRHLTKDCIDRKLKTQTNLTGLAKILGCETSEVSELVDGGTLMDPGNKRITRDCIFDLESVSNTFTVALLDCANQANGLVAARKLQHLFPLFHSNWSTILTGIAQGSISAVVVQSSPSFIDRLRVSEAEFMAAIHANLHGLAAEKVSKSVASRILNVPTALFKELALAEVLTPLRWHSTDTYLVGDIIQVLERYLIISRLAKINNVSKAFLKKSIEGSGDEPVIGRYIYKRTSALESGISKALGYQVKYF